jgi:hypothetical protein
MKRKGEKKKKGKGVKKYQTGSNLVKLRPNLKGLGSLNIKLSEEFQTADFDKIHSNLKFGIQIP